MDELKLFLNNFVEKDYEANVAKFVERDEQIFQQTVEQVQSFFVPGLEPQITRRPNPNESWFEQVVSQKQLQRKGRRTVFKVEQYSHLTLGNVYRVYVSSNRLKSPSYFQSLFIRKIDGHFKFFSRYLIDTTNSMGWSWNGGEKLSLNTFKEPIAECKFTPPSDPDDLEDYNN